MPLSTPSTSATHPENAHIFNISAVSVRISDSISVSASEHFVQQVAELPADHGVAGQRQVEGVGPEGGGSTLLMCSHDDVAHIFLFRRCLTGDQSFADAVELLFTELLFLGSQSFFRLIVGFVLGFAHVVPETPRTLKVYESTQSSSGFQLLVCALVPV